MNKLVIGLCAHVDAGKTTLSESMLYLSGAIRRMGRVDNKDAHLDTFELEQARGITIFAKQALLEVAHTRITLLDTPGHVDFSLEMERTLQVLDYAVLVINGADGVQGHTRTLWHLLDNYQIPVFLFINKMDQVGAEREKLIKELKSQLSDGCLDFGQPETPDFYEQLALCHERLLDEYLTEGRIELPLIREGIRKRQVYPCFFGSALKLEGVEELLQGIVKYAQRPSYGDVFGAKLFKIGRDEQGNRLTYLKITGGSLKVRESLSNGVWEEKVNQIRIYSGKKFEAVQEAEAGSVCAVTGLTQTKPGEGLGIEAGAQAPLLEPVLAYQMILPEGCDPRVMLPKLRQLEEEDPGLQVVWDEALREIQVQIMGEVQLEILQSLIQSRFGLGVSFGAGRIVYKETIGKAVEGVGHFEPLRHYAEVHLLLEPGERGSGLRFGSACSEDNLSKSWQRLVLSHLEEKVHKGVLTGSPLTDLKLTLVAGRAHTKHTGGGDFREATYRAVRQGLMEAESILLEPFYAFHLELPEKLVGRAMNDVEKMHGTCRLAQVEGERAVLTGSAPVAAMRNYQQEVMAYSKGLGRLFCSLQGYEPCHNPVEVIALSGYDPERDVDNPADSVFCAQGSGFLVPWYQVKAYMHVESCFSEEPESAAAGPKLQTSYAEEQWIDPEEIDRILNQTYYANQGKKSLWQQRKKAAESYYRPPADGNKPKETQEEYLLVDGYNIIFAWPELKALAQDTMDGARMKLLDILSNYQGIRKCRIIVVFDAYRVQGHPEEAVEYHNILMVYTKEAQTADHYIERFAYDHQKKYRITVATSDGLQQIIIRGAGCALLSARDLREEVIMANQQVIEAYQAQQPPTRHYLKDALSAQNERQIKEYLEGEKD